MPVSELLAILRMCKDIGDMYTTKDEDLDVVENIDIRAARKKIKELKELLNKEEVK